LSDWLDGLKSAAGVDFEGLWAQMVFTLFSKILSIIVLEFDLDTTPLFIVDTSYPFLRIENLKPKLFSPFYFCLSLKKTTLENQGP